MNVNVTESLQSANSQQRQELLSNVANLINIPSQVHILRVAIDGVDGAGKTIFADELAQVLQEQGRTVIRASVDDFHNTRAKRYEKGRTSPEGFFLDSYNYYDLKKVLLDPLSPGGTGKYRSAIFDHTTDLSVTSPEREAASDAIFVIDGIFLHRPELRGYWDFSIFLDVKFDVSVPRMALRDLGSPDPADEKNHRYVGGQKLYLEQCDPKRYATITINNSNLAAPYIVSAENANR